MDEKYRLIFRGEILEGQHRAVVKRRLAAALKLDEARLDTLFSGKPVVLKRGVDRKTAARYQAVFKEAGGQLRVRAEQPQGGQTPPSTAEPAAAPAAAVPSAAEPSGKAAWNADIAAPDFTVQASHFSVPDEPRPEIEAPDFPLAEVGSNMAEKVDPPVPRVAEVNFDLAEAGADLLVGREPDVVADVGPLDFDLAEVGADLGPESNRQTPAAPDVSHLAIIEP